MAIEHTPVPTGELTGKVMFYNRPEPLSPEAHGKLGLSRADASFSFAARANIVPIQVGEFGLAALNYPLIFAGEEKAPMAVLGLKPGESLFVTPAGRFADNCYVPGFVRRYPFVLAGDGGDEKLIVCIDRDAPMLKENGDIPLFENGKLTQAGESAVQFCSDFETERRRTDQFVARLKELDLFEPKAATFTPRNPDGTMGQTVQLADYFAVSEEKLQALSDADLRELHTTNALRQIHAHIISMANWERLVGRAALQAPVAGNA